MKAMNKIVLVTTGLISMGALTACQTTTQAPQEVKKGHYDKKHHHKERLTPEQREQFKQARADRKAMMQQIRQACDGKAVGQTVQIKTDKQNIDGTCHIRFVADRADMKKMHEQARAKFKAEKPTSVQANRSQKGEPLTDAKRAELVQKFDQRLMQQQVSQNAKLQACNGQTDGKKVQIKVGEQTINGVCKVYFKPNQLLVKPDLKKSA